MKLPRPTIYLFDIDGTILLTGGAGRRAFAHAFEQVAGRRDAVAHFSFEGMTDLAIARAGLTAISREPTPELMHALVEAYLAQLTEELKHTTGYVVMPFVRETVALLSACSGAAIGLGTGNVKRGAQAKLSHGNLWHLFAFGGFGCDHEQRSALLAHGAERGAHALGEALEACRVVVIGDTTRDVQAAHAIGAECLAVCTGGGTFESLREAGADVVFHDLGEAGTSDWLLAR